MAINYGPRLVTLALATLPILWWGVATGAPTAQRPSVSAFVDVNVVPMDAERVLPHQTVLVRGDTIVRVAPVAEVPIPPDALRIEGRGTAYVLPGLADMHTHVESVDDATLYLANGITTVLQMGGGSIFPVRRIRADIAAGTILAPQVFFALMVDGPIPVGGGWPVDSVIAARAAVTMAKSFGYDFMKVYNELGAAEFDALVDEAHKDGLAVVGHGVRAVGLPAGLFKGQVMVAHAEEFYYTAFANKANYAAIPEVVEKTYQSKAYVTPNLSAFEVISQQWGKPAQVLKFLTDPRLQFVSLETRLALAGKDYGSRSGDISPILEFLRRFTKALSDRGVPLLAGTDSPAIPGMLPGYSIHEDLRTLQETGMTPYQALSAATRTPGEFIATYVPSAAHFGVVAAGYRADLVLIARNPLQSLAVLRTPLGVMHGGHWTLAEELQAALVANKTRNDSKIRDLMR
jgi:imidazolonepropionase-like amidohydrolase